MHGTIKNFLKEAVMLNDYKNMLCVDKFFLIGNTNNKSSVFVKSMLVALCEK